MSGGSCRAPWFADEVMAWFDTTGFKDENVVLMRRPAGAGARSGITS